MPNADALLSRAIAEWNRGEHYEAHETLEDFADEIEDDDREHHIALALLHIAAALHKLVNDVGKSAVPAKIERALTDLSSAPEVWRGIELGRLKKELRVLLDGSSSATPQLHTK
jgi:hypothetical protein